MIDMESYESSLKEFEEKPDFDLVISSAVPAACREKECVMGIDEAGRGPVLGPMVYGGCIVVREYEEDLKKAGHADSKGLKEEVREELFEKMHSQDKENVAYFAHIISPNVICNKMLDKAKTNLNTISQSAAVGLIRRALDAGMNIKQVTLDTVGPPEKYQAKVAEIFPDLKIVVESKADVNYPVVSAASVVAKVTRDACIRRWRFLEQLPEKERQFGCGYPSDPITKQFLLNHCDATFGFPQFVRTSWSTASVLMEKRCHHVLWEDIEEEKAKPARKRKSANEEPANEGSSLLSFFAPTPASRKRKRHRFFRDRKLERVVGALV